MAAFFVHIDVISENFLIFAVRCGKAQRPIIRRNGRVVDGGSLENCCTATYRGFESLFLRKVTEKVCAKLA